MTRRNMMYLFYNLLNAETRDGQVYAQTLGYTLNDNGEIDYLSMVSDTMQGPYVVEGSLSDIVSGDNKTVYRNGYASTADAVQKYDVVYYNDSAIWAYANAVTGTYQSASPSTSSPTSVTVAGNTYEIETSDAAFELSTLGGLNIGDIVTLLLGRDGKVAAALPADEYATGCGRRGDRRWHGDVLQRGRQCLHRAHDHRHGDGRRKLHLSLLQNLDRGGRPGFHRFRFCRNRCFYPEVRVAQRRGVRLFDRQPHDGKGCAHPGCE